MLIFCFIKLLLVGKIVLPRVGSVAHPQEFFESFVSILSAFYHYFTVPVPAFQLAQAARRARQVRMWY